MHFVRQVCLFEELIDLQEEGKRKQRDINNVNQNNEYRRVGILVVTESILMGYDKYNTIPTCILFQKVEFFTPLEVLAVAMTAC